MSNYRLASIDGRRRRQGTMTPVPSGPLVSDTFTRANGAIGTAETGQAWIDNGAGWTITSDVVATTVAQSTLGTQSAVIDAGVSDCTVSAKFSTYSSAMFIAFRQSNVTNTLAFYLSGTNTARILQVNAGTQTTIFTGTTNTTIASGDVYSVVLSGSSVILKQNGVQVGTTQTITFNQTATKHGIGTNTNAFTKFDNFTVTVP